jgi:hypothetical protein
VAKRIDASAARELFLKNDLEPLVDFPGSQKPWKSKCLISGKTVSPTYGKVRDYGHRCSYCSGNQVDEIEAIALMNKAGFKTLVTYPGGNKPWKSQCLKCKKIFSPQYTSIKLGFGCRYCAHRAVDPKDAITSMMKRGFKVLEDFPGATKPWLVECLMCNKSFKTKFHSLNTKNKCKYCSGVYVDESDLLIRLKELKLKPLEKYVSAKTPWKCKCLVCNHIVQPTWMRIKQGRGHCAYCSQRRVDIPEAFKFMKSINLKPLVDFPGNNKPWLCKCLVCKNEVKPRWSGLRQGQGGCSNCADYGLNYELSGYLYVITNPKMKSHKIGIANSYKLNESDDRLKRHEKLGWILVEKHEFKKVRTAYEVEKEVLRWLRIDLALSFNLNSNQMPQGGFTEIVSADYLEVQAITKKVKEIIKSL